MGSSSNLNLKNFAGEPPNMRPHAGDNLPLTRQSSVYSLTFDEFQSAVGGGSKDLGSMNMDELLKSIWSAEENQNLGTISGGGVLMSAGHQDGGGNPLQKQGSFTLPRTLSQKTVEEVWRDMVGGSSSGINDAVPSFGMAQREPTLGEVTLEDFLVRAGVVREDAQMAVEANNLGLFGDLPSPTLDNMGLKYGFQQQQEVGIESSGLVGNNNRIHASNAGAAQLQQQQKQQQILPKQPILAFGATAGIPTNTQMASPRVRNLGISDQAGMIVQGAAALGMSGLGQNGVAVTTPPPSDGLTKNSNGDTSSVSPIPYLFNGGIRGRKSAALEKVIERRQRRMIKNRESAARSRARKQAYTMELEAEVAKLKEENEELQKKQAEILEIQKKQPSLIFLPRKLTATRCLNSLAHSCNLTGIGDDESAERTKETVLEEDADGPLVKMENDDRCFFCKDGILLANSLCICTCWYIFSSLT